MGIFDKIFTRKNKDFAATNELMGEDAFWKIIKNSNLNSKGDYEIQQQELAKELHKLNPNDIIKFYNRFCFLKWEAYTWQLWGAIYIIQGGCGDDSFNDFREWVIGQGKEFYYRTIQDPETLVDIDEDEILIEWEGLGYVPFTLFRELTGHDMPYLLPENDDTIRNSEPSGQEWEEDDLKQMFPKLFAKYPDNV